MVRAFNESQLPEFLGWRIGQAGHSRASMYCLGVFYPFFQAQKTLASRARHLRNLVSVHGQLRGWARRIFSVRDFNLVSMLMSLTRSTMKLFDTESLFELRVLTIMLSYSLRASDERRNDTTNGLFNNGSLISFLTKGLSILYPSAMNNANRRLPSRANTPSIELIDNHLS